MNEHQANNCFDEYVLTRWSDWKPSSVVRGDWILLFEKYDERTVQKALHEFAGHPKNIRKGPHFPSVKTILKSLTFGYKKKADVKPLFWLMRKKDGILKPIYPKHGETYSDERITRESQSMAKARSEFYQAEWVVVRSTEDKLEMKPEFDDEAGMMSIDELASAVDDKTEHLPF